MSVRRHSGGGFVQKHTLRIEERGVGFGVCVEEAALLQAMHCGETIFETHSLYWTSFGLLSRRQLTSH